MLASLTDPLAGLAIDPIEERWAIMYAATGPNQAFVQNPNELVFLDVSQPPETATLRAHTLHSFGGRPARLTFTPTLALPGGDRRLLIVESDQDLSILDLADPDKRDLGSAHQRQRQPPPGPRRASSSTTAIPRATMTRASACGCRTIPASSR